ncbi:glycosyltransferase [Blautia argi]|uniref:glycosyltransferase n=1 Tax=Blautia argi TaxID=1912897 RepID=UPI001FA93474|nr:glycosyltransferase [Blautia argi]
MSQYLKIALIPAYNPEECLIQVVQQLSEKGFWILIVDDGSDKEHKPIFQEIDDAGNVLILPHETNKGKGSALKTGMAYIQNHISENYVVVTADADGQTQSKRCRNGMERG